MRIALAGSTGPRRLDIWYPTTEFTKQVKSWEKFDESSMGIVVRHIKRCDTLALRMFDRASIRYIERYASSSLPDHVFDEGERQPKPTLKRPKPTKVRQLSFGEDIKSEWIRMTRLTANRKRSLRIFRTRSESEAIQGV